MGIGVSGLMSGLDTESIISGLMELERRPILLLQRREADFQSKISAIGTLKSALNDLKSAIDALKDSDNFESFAATSSNTETLEVSAGSGALPGYYHIEVTNLAQAQYLRSSAFTSDDAVVGTGTITIQVGSDTPVEIEIDSEHNTLSEIASAINDADLDVTAAVIHDGNGNYYLTLASNKTGTDNTISFTIQDDDGNNDDASGLSALYTDPANHTLTETQAAENAQLTINGINVERSSNTIDDLIEGVTLDLKKEAPGETVNVEVSRNFSSITSKVQDFVDKYNSLVDTFTRLQSYNAETKEAGTLLGDSTTSQIRYRLQRMLYTQVSGIADEVNGLSKLGIEVDRNGKLSLNESELTDALENHLDDVVNFFTLDENGVQGLAVQLDDILDSYLNSYDGILKAKEDGLQASIDRIEDQIERINLRLAQREENLRRQFNALEELLGQYQQTSGFLEQQLASLTRLTNSIVDKAK